MRLTGFVSDLFSSRSKIAVIRVLVRGRGGEFTGRELARLAGCSAPQANAALHQLDGLGFVTWRVVGKAHVWRLVEDHVLLEPIRSLFSFEDGLPGKFRAELKAELEKLPIQSATLFGSLARGAESNRSDADLYLRIHRAQDEDELQKRLTSITRRFIRRYGTVISPLIHTDEKARKPRNPALIRSISEEGIPLVGAKP